MKKKIKFPHRLKQDGSADAMCLACFKTITPVVTSVSRSDSSFGSEAAHLVEEHDHVCAFSFPERRANEITFEDGPKRRKSDMDWQALISRDAIYPVD